LRLRNTEDERYVKNGVKWYRRVYDIVGECYVHGGMNGQLFSEYYLAECVIV
jgi:hypothetical protein